MESVHISMRARQIFGHGLHGGRASGPMSTKMSSTVFQSCQNFRDGFEFKLLGGNQDNGGIALHM